VGRGLGYFRAEGVLEPPSRLYGAQALIS
jgi:hypothetical protein